jgi:hypothetical protein
MQHFVRNKNIALYKKLIAESENDPSRDEKRHATLLTLLTDPDSLKIRLKPDRVTVERYLVRGPARHPSYLQP